MAQNSYKNMMILKARERAARYNISVQEALDQLWQMTEEEERSEKADREANEVFLCAKCGAVKSKKDALCPAWKGHGVAATPNDEEDLEIPTVAADGSKSLGCYGCDSSFATADDLEAHEKTTGHGEHTDMDGTPFSVRGTMDYGTEGREFEDAAVQQFDPKVIQPSNDPTALEALEQGYAVLMAVLVQWEAKGLEPDFFQTPYEVNETLATMRYAIAGLREPRTWYSR